MREPASAGPRRRKPGIWPPQLGLDVKLDAVSYLRPGAVLYEGVELSDPETGQTLFRCRLLEVAWGEQTDEQGQRRPTLSMTASQPQVEAAALQRTWRWLQDLLASQLGRLQTDVQLSAAEVTLHAADGSQTLTDVEGLVEGLPGGTHAQVHFRLVGAIRPSRPASASSATARSRRRQAASSSTPAAASCPATCWRWDWRS